LSAEEHQTLIIDTKVYPGQVVADLVQKPSR
jgi:hypothetical protein